MAGKTENNKKIRLLFFILSSAVQMSLHLTDAKPQINLGKFSFDQFQLPFSLIVAKIYVSVCLPCLQGSKIRGKLQFGLKG